MVGKIRQAVLADAAQIIDIYAPFCRDSHVSFEISPPTLAEMAARIGKLTLRFPWLVYERDGIVHGYVYAGPHRERAAYRWSVDVAVYVGEGQRGQGLGRILYAALFGLLAEQGFCNAYAGIALPNPASISLHRALGFEPVGVYRSVGYKQGCWRDVAWWGLRLKEYPTPPAEPVDIVALIGGESWERALRPAEKLLAAD